MQKNNIRFYIFYDLQLLNFLKNINIEYILKSPLPDLTYYIQLHVEYITMKYAGKHSNEIEY